MSARAARVFVYGTLLRGERNHPLLAGCALAGPARTAPRYTLLDLGSYPGLVEGGTDSVAGEVYEVDAAGLAALDELEGHPAFYRRALVELASGATGVEAYLLPPGDAARYPRIAGGDWRAHRQARNKQSP